MDGFRECLSYDDVLLVPRFSSLESRSQTDIGWMGYSMPVATAPMDLITTPEMVRYFYANKMLATIHRYFRSINEQINFIQECIDESGSENEHDFLNSVYISVGTIKKYREWIDALSYCGIRRYLIDLAHGDCQLCLDTIRYIKNLDSANKVIAGNVATKSGFNRLQNAGADGVRCGIGGGHSCTTRINTAFGVPTLSTLQDCAAVKKDGVMMIACGGIKSTGDIVKAMAVGADVVILGKMLAGTDLAGGICYDKDMSITYPEYDVRYREYYGMASRKARDGILVKGSVEGAVGLVPYTGTTESLFDDIRMNLHAALSYGGADNWGDFRRQVKMIRISNSSWNESNSHLL